MSTFRCEAKLKFLGAFLLLVGSMSLQAGGSMYIPLLLSPEIESRIERLFVMANMPIIKRPIPVKEVYVALERLGNGDPVLSQSVRLYLKRFSNRAGITHFHASLGVVKGEAVSIPNARGEQSDSTYSASVIAYLVASDWLIFNVGGSTFDNSQKGDFPENSFISLGWEMFQVDIGYRPHWLGPFQDSDMLYSTHAPSLPGITFSNTRPYSRFGILYEVFLAQLSKSDQVASQNGLGRVTGAPRLLGVHLSFQPVDGFAIGFNRLLQFGGADRDDSPRSIFNALTNPSKYDNIGDEGADFGNQLSSVTTRYILSGDIPLSVYMEYAGEDTSASSDFALGNTSLMFGLHLPKLMSNYDFTYEYASWQNLWYINGVYLDGLTNYGHILGHWGGDRREFEDPVGAITHMAKLIWSIDQGQSMTFQGRSIKNESYSSQNYKAGREITLEYSRGLERFISGVRFIGGESVFGERYAQLTGFVRW